MTYSLVILPEPQECHDCGEDTDQAYVADSVQQADGYLDQLVICPTCLEIRQERER